MALKAGDAKGAKFTGETVRKEDGSYEVTAGKTVSVQKPATPPTTPLESGVKGVGKGIEIANAALTLGTGEISAQIVKGVAGAVAEDYKLGKGTSDKNYEASGKIGESVAAANKSLLDKTTEVQTIAEEPDSNDQMSEQVEKGLKEASTELANAIKEALSRGKLPIDGMAKLTGQMEQFTKQFMNAQKNDQSAQAMIDAITELKKTLKDLTK